MYCHLAALALLAATVAAQGGCPSTDITLEDWIANAGGTHGACATDDHCPNEGECCVDYHVGYCGVPSACNEYLACRGPGSGAAFSVSSMNEGDAPIPETNEEFQALLSRADGGGAFYDGCPPPTETWEDYLAKGGPCTTNIGCAADNAGSCCIAYSYPYCGVPSDCNPYLQCFSPTEEAAAVADAIEEYTGIAPEDQSEAFAAALAKLQTMGAGNETTSDGTDPGMPDMGGDNVTDTDPGMGDGTGTDPTSGIIEKLGACVGDLETMDLGSIDMQCIQGVLSTLDPAIIGKLAQCAGGASMDEMQACVQEQLASAGGGGDEMTATAPPVSEPAAAPVAAPVTAPTEAAPVMEPTAGVPAATSGASGQMAAAFAVVAVFVSSLLL